MEANSIHPARRAWLECMPWCLLYGAVRLPRITAIPIFFDEAVYLRWAQQIVRGEASPFISLKHGIAPGLVWLATPFLHCIDDPLVAGRVATVAAGLATLLGIFTLVYECGGLPSARRAAIFYLAAPMFVLYDRLAVHEGLLAAAAAWLWAFAVRYIQRARPADLAGVFVATAIGCLTKSSFLVVIVGFGAAVALLAAGRRAALIAAAIAGVLAAAVSISPWTGDVAVQNARAWDGLVRSLTDPIGQWIPLLGTHAWWLMIFFTPLPLLTMILGAWRRADRPIRLLAIAFGVEFLALAVLVPRDLANPRYLVLLGPLLIAVPVLICDASFPAASRSITAERRGAGSSIAVRLGGMFRGWLSPRLRSVAFYFGMVLPCAVNSALLMGKPAAAVLPRTERFQLITGWPSGHGICEIARQLGARHPMGDVWVYVEGTSPLVLSGLQLYLPEGRVRPIDPREFLEPDRLFASAAAPAGGYLVTHEFQYVLRAAELELLAEYPKPEGMYVMRLYRVRGTRGVFDQRGGP